MLRLLQIAVLVLVVAGALPVPQKVQPTVASFLQRTSVSEEVEHKDPEDDQLRETQTKLVAAELKLQETQQDRELAERKLDEAQEKLEEHDHKLDAMRAMKRKMEEEADEKDRMLQQTHALISKQLASEAEGLDLPSPAPLKLVEENAEITDLKASLDDVQKKVAVAEDKAKVSRKEVLKLQTELKEANEEVAVATQGAKAFKIRDSEASKQDDTTQKKVEAIDAEAERKLEHTQKEYSREIKAVWKEAEHLQSDFADRQKELLLAEEEEKDASKQAAKFKKLDKLLKSETAAVKEAEEEVSELKANLNKAQDKAKDGREKLKLAKKDKEVKVSRMKRERSSLTLKNDKGQKAVHTMAQKLALHEAKAEEAEHRVEDQRKENEEKVSQLKEELRLAQQVSREKAAEEQAKYAKEAADLKVKYDEEVKHQVTLIEAQAKADETALTQKAKDEEKDLRDQVEEAKEKADNAEAKLKKQEEAQEDTLENLRADLRKVQEEGEQQRKEDDARIRELQFKLDQVKKDGARKIMVEEEEAKEETRQLSRAQKALDDVKDKTAEEQLQAESDAEQLEAIKTGEVKQVSAAEGILKSQSKDNEATLMKESASGKKQAESLQMDIMAAKDSTSMKESALTAELEQKMKHARAKALHDALTEQKLAQELEKDEKDIRDVRAYFAKEGQAAYAAENKILALREHFKDDGHAPTDEEREKEEGLMEFWAKSMKDLKAAQPDLASVEKSEDVQSLLQALKLKIREDHLKMQTGQLEETNQHDTETRAARLAETAKQDLLNKQTEEQKEQSVAKQTVLKLQDEEAKQTKKVTTKLENNQEEVNIEQDKPHEYQGPAFWLGDANQQKAKLEAKQMRLAATLSASDVAPVVAAARPLGAEAAVPAAAAVTAAPVVGTSQPLAPVGVAPPVDAAPLAAAAATVEPPVALPTLLLKKAGNKTEKEEKSEANSAKKETEGQSNR